MTSRIVQFVGGTSGEWAVTDLATICGDPLADVAAIAVTETPGTTPHSWTLRGAISNLRYTIATERTSLQSRQAGLGRPQAQCAALIPITKSAAWWALAQDERLAIYSRSQHTQVGLEYLPAIARRLHHSRDLDEPFDFLTWFEFAEADSAAFDHLLVRLRASEEWQYVTREVDIRLRRC